VDASVVEQTIRGIEAEGANLGMLITSGMISDQASRRAQKYFEEEGIKIELVDGGQFAKLIVEHGIATTWRPFWMPARVVNRESGHSTRVGAAQDRGVYPFVPRVTVAGG
jgi:hypothetical protein